QLTRQQKHTARTDRLRNYVSALHSELDLKRCGYALANYAQEILGVYRCTAGSYSPTGKFRIQAVSGLESIAVKSAMLKDLEAICKEVCKNGKPLIVDNPHAAMKAQTAGDDDLVTAARLYMVQGESLVMGIFPIRSPEKHIVGAIVIEKAVEEEFSRPQVQQVEALLTEAGVAIRNCQKYRDLPMQPLMRATASVRDKYLRAPSYKKRVWIGILLAIVILPLVITRHVKVIGNAELVAENTRYLYAQTDGIIESVNIPEDRIVKAGDLLVKFDTRIIETELTRVAGRIDEADIAQRQSRSKGLAEDARRYELSSMAMRAEQAKYQYMLENHVIKSPIDGMVTTRQTEIRELIKRPVKAGDLVLEVIPSEPSWEFQVHVPEDEAGNLLRAWHSLAEGESLKANLLMKAYPETSFETEVLSLSSKAHVETTGEQKYRNVITVVVRQPEELKGYELRQGMEGKVAIKCGRRNLVYILTHEFTDFIRVNTF
ncbi:MAG: HlyD family efflux transporter periplasmic adaptor subunit, partial [Sedimentisphaerales bacterium]|nr:HlyD family efflux transporter periplasmic adaptor subunit [Sedimentisphaerales bacterium]